MSNYKLYQDPKIRKTLRLARKQAERREVQRHNWKVQDWRAKHVKNYRRSQNA